MFFEIKVVKQLIIFFVCNEILHKNGEHGASILPSTLKFVYKSTMFLICGLNVPRITALFVTLKTLLQTTTNTSFK